MAGTKGIDVRETAGQLVFRHSLKDSAGAKVTTGTTTLRLYEVQADGTLLSYDFNDNTFKATALTTATLAMTHRQGNNNTYNVGVWTAVLSTLGAFTAGRVYVVQVNNTGASPPEQEREFQFGGAEGDLLVESSFLEVDVEHWRTAQPDALSSGKLPSDVKLWLASAPDALSSGKLPSDVKLWLASAPDALSSGKIAADVKLWLTGTPDALSSGKLPADVKLWLTVAPASLTTNGYVKAMLLRWLSDDAGGTPSALSSGRVDSLTGAMSSNVVDSTALATSAANEIRDAILSDGISFPGARVDTTISSRSSHTAADVWAVTTRTLSSFGTLVADVAAAVWAAAGRTLSSFGFSVTVGTNNDKTGYALTSVERTAIANEVEAQIIDDTDSEKVLQAIVDKIAAANPSLDDLTLGAIASAVRTELATELARIDVATGTRLATAGYTAPDNAGIGSILTKATAIDGRLPSDPSDASDIASAFGTVNSTLATIAAYLDTEVLAILAKVNNLPSDPADASDVASLIGAVSALVTAVKARTDNLPTDPADASDVAALIAAVSALITAVKAKTDQMAFTVAGALNSNATHVEGKVLSSKVGDNIDAFFQNLGVDTTKVVDDVGTGGGGGGGGGPTQQQIRDAMMLAPTAGAPAVGSVDKELDDIFAKVASIGTGQFKIISPVSPDGKRIYLVHGDDHVRALNNAVEIELDPGVDLSTATLKFSIGEAAAGSPALFTIGAFAEATGDPERPWRLVAEPSAANMSIPVGAGGDGKAYAFDFEATLSGKKLTRVIGTAFVRQDVTP